MARNYIGMIAKLFRRRWLRNALRMHHWRYRNPFDRTCRVCGRHEVFHGFDTALTHQNGWWELFDDGDATAKPCGRKPEPTDRITY